MNVLIVVPWDQEFGGVTSVVRSLAGLLEKKGHHICLLVPAAEDGLRPKVTKCKLPGYELKLRLPFDPRVPVKSTLAFVYYLFNTLLCLGSFLRNNKIDIVNIHYPGEQCVYFALLRRMLSFKLVVSVHGTDLLPDGKPAKSYSWAIRFLMKSADLLVAPSLNTLEHVLTKFPHLREKALCIHNGVNLNEFESSDHSDSGGAEYILCVASHHPYKAIDVLIKAFQNVRRTHEKVELHLAGDGPLRGELEELARDLGVGQYVKFLGWQDPKQIRKLLQECSLLVLPSRAEAFGIVLLEALACRRPVVATEIDGFPEIILDGLTCSLVEGENPRALSEAIVKILNNKALAESMASAGYASVKQHFQWEMAIQKYETAFMGLLS
jgi:glycosyltransferase involved in cell wall biosynthesis